MWEQVSWYGMRSLLVYYLTRGLHFAESRASLVYGAYTAAVFLTPIFGGIASDRFLGPRRAVLCGGVLMAVGHFLLAFQHMLYPALALIAVGTGLFLPSLPSQVAALYPTGDARQGPAYNVYYVGVNLGAFLAPFICGTLGERLGWHWGFGAAGIGMLISLLIYATGARYLPNEGKRPVPGRIAAVRPKLSRRCTLTLIQIALVVALFRGAYEQVGNTVALWAELGVNRHLTATWIIPATWFQSLDPLIVFVLGPLLAIRWTRQARAGRDMLSVRKMAIGAALVGCAYLLIATVIEVHRLRGTTPDWGWVVIFFAVFTSGELFILPVGLALFGTLAPPGLTATLIAGWFLAGFFGNLLAGAFGTLWSSMTHAQFFVAVAALAWVASGLLLSFEKRMRDIEGAAPSALPLRHA
jgi:POT family proton-dependent oligopeptide transporter